MNSKKNAIPLLIWILVVSAFPAVAEQAVVEQEIELDYRRDAVRRDVTKQAGSRQAGSRQAAPRPELPSALRGTPRDDGTPRGDGPRIEKLRSAVSKTLHDRYHAEARRAAAWTARELAEKKGRHEAYHLGFYDGLHRAFDDPRLGRFDYRQGLDRGRRSRDAEARGHDLGYELAHATAERRAHDEVDAQFRDLQREPYPHPRAMAPPFQVKLARAAKPRLRDVFHDYPLRGFVRTPYVEPLPDPWKLYRYEAHDDFYDRKIHDADHAFAYWRRYQRSAWDRIPEEARAPFEKVFHDTYGRELDRAYYEMAKDAYYHGFDHGWDYGAHVNAEWKYRRGYREGWNEALAENAKLAYFRGFPRAYEELYTTYFEEWSTSARPEIRSIALLDSNDDGVFEPGETIWAEYELVNYGGAPGRFDASLSGAVLSAGASARVRLPRRQVWRGAAALEVRIDGAVRPRTEADLTFAIGDLESRLPLRVSYPLEIDRRVSLVSHDSLAGRAVLEVTVENTSRRQVSAALHLSAPRYEKLDLGLLRSGEKRAVAFELAGLAPLDLLGGAVEVELEASSRGRYHDELAYRLPALALDLGDRDLIFYMEDLARRASAPVYEIRHAQELMLDRLRVDWDAVVARGGNAYKSDFKNGTRATALGDLVASWRGGRRTFRHGEVFTALAPRIEALAKSTPGRHPFLRRSMKKLAYQLQGSGRPGGER